MRGSTLRSAGMDQPAAEAWHIRPNGPLVGEVQVSGSKNAVTKHMVAAMLGHRAQHDHQRPRGRRRRHHGRHPHVAGRRRRHRRATASRSSPSAAPDAEVPLEFTGLNRIPILLLGPLLHRNHEAFVPLVGGDRIGRRPVDFHIDALEAMGAEVEVRPTTASAPGPTACTAPSITLPYPSVGATESVLLTAVLAEGRTVLRNAAIEPEVIELALFLQRMGAPHRLQARPPHRHRGRRTPARRRRPAAGRPPRGVLLPGGRADDRRPGAGAGCAQDRLVTAIDTLQKMGARFEITDEYISASADAGLRPAAVQTDTHPGFMTDWQPPLIVLMTQAEGMSVLHETVYEDRLGLRRGADPDGLRDRAVRHLPGRAGLPLPRHQRHALGGRAGRVQAARRRGHHPRRAGRILVGHRRRRRRRARRRCTASTTSSAATTGRSRRSSRWGCASSGSRSKPDLSPAARVSPKPGWPGPRWRRWSRPGSSRRYGPRAPAPARRRGACWEDGPGRSGCRPPSPSPAPAPAMPRGPRRGT